MRLVHALFRIPQYAFGATETGVGKDNRKQHEFYENET